MKIIVTGSSGFFGKIICDCLSNYKIVTIGRNNEEIYCDLSISIPNKLPKVDMIVHAAGKAHLTSKSKFDSTKYFESNIKCTQNLLNGLTLTNIPKQFVFISSVAVYGRDVGRNISENEQLNAKDSYGLSKIQIEQLVTDWCNKNDVVCTILRLPLLLGKNPPGNLGTMLKAINKGYYFNIGGGKAKKSMVLAEDVAHFIPIIASTGGIYNLTDGVHPSFNDLSFSIAKKQIINVPLIVAQIIGFIGDIIGDKVPINSLKIKKIISDLTFEDSKARQLGWNPQSVLEYLKTNDL